MNSCEEADGALLRNLGSHAGPDAGVGPWERLVGRSTATFRGRLLPLHLLEYVGGHCLFRGGGRTSWNCPQLALSGSQTTFEPANLQNEGTATLLPSSKFNVNFSFVPQTQTHTIKRMLGNVVPLSLVVTIQTTTVHLGYWTLCEGGAKSGGWGGKCTAYIARVYKQDIISKERANGPCNSVRSLSTKHQNKCYSQKLKTPKKRCLKKECFSYQFRFLLPSSILLTALKILCRKKRKGLRYADRHLNSLSDFIH